ncbi:hypothetical protein Q3A66_12115 [Hymenobacter sp. BT770]|uniref:hypothetical protein n=1 Tax=Hymenobacter sp. BT770 TaxID=2886942 RepID=UPI001D0FB1D9|nr:hypothetical protein [Hymenobacter sp. BT770]MCC3153577.1 hypothetical protein [Hymenobacter sp. BT770]MDO3415813.1 hypothetical protein [Hymenobacter sp. BT770]
MKRPNTSRSEQPLAAAQSSTRARSFMAAPHFRAALLGGLALLGSAGTALAQDAPSVKAKQPDAASLWVTIENPAKKAMQMQVINLDSYNSLINEVNHRPSNGYHLSFRKVPAGRYAVLLRVGRERYRYTVQVKAQPQTIISVNELAPATAAPSIAAISR